MKSPTEGTAVIGEEASNPDKDAQEQPDEVVVVQPSRLTQLTGFLGGYVPSLPTPSWPSFFSSGPIMPSKPPKIMSTKCENVKEQVELYLEDYTRLRDKMLNIENHYSEARTSITWQATERKEAIDLIKTLTMTLPRTTFDKDILKARDEIVNSIGILLGLCCYVTDTIKKEYEKGYLSRDPNKSALYRVLNLELEDKSPKHKHLFTEELYKAIRNSSDTDKVLYGTAGQAGVLRSINATLIRLDAEVQRASAATYTM